MSSRNLDIRAWLLPDLNTLRNNCVRKNSFLLFWLWYWVFVQTSLVQIPSKSYISAMHLLIGFYVTDFVRKTLDQVIAHKQNVKALLKALPNSDFPYAIYQK